MRYRIYYEFALPFKVERIKDEFDEAAEEDFENAHLRFSFGECGTFNQIDVDQNVIDSR